jgi:PST family polysaccharide transporter
MDADTQPDPESVLSAYDFSGGSIGRQTSFGGLIAVASQITRLMIQLAGVAILARLLDPADFGLVAMAATVAGFVSLFGDLGLSTATLQRKTLTQAMVSTLFYVGLAVALFVTVVTMLLSGVASQFYGDPRVGPLTIGLALAIPLAAAGAQHGALMARGMRWVAIQAAAITGQATGLTIAILIAWRTDLGYWALVAQVVVGQLCTLVMQWSACKWRPSMTLGIQQTFREIGFGVNLTGFGLANYFHRQIDNVMIGKRWGEAELGFYTRAYSLVALPMTMVNSAIGSAVIPLLSRHQDDSKAWRSYFLRSLSLTCFGAYGLACILTVNADGIILFVLGDSWVYSGTILFYLTFSLFPIAPMNAMGWVFISLDKSARWLRWGLFTSALFPLAYYAGLSFRSEGVAIAYSLSVAALAVPCIWYASRGTSITSADVVSAIRSPLVASVVTLAIGLLLRPVWRPMGSTISLVLGVFVTTAVFGLVSLALLFIDKQQESQRRLLWSLLKGHS